MLLSVLSALARLDVDPWQEAAELAGLPGKTATERLASLIATLPEEPSAQRDPRTIAAHLIARLPRRARSDIPFRGAFLGVGGVSDSRARKISTILIGVIVVAVVLGSQWVIASRQLAARADNAHAPASTSISAETRPPKSGF